MNKKEKTDILNESISKKKMITCEFTCDISYSHFYVTKVSNTLMIGAEEFDFFIKGYELMKLSRLKKVKLAYDSYNEINEYIGLVDNIENYNIDISSMYNALKDIKKLDRIVMVYCDNSPSSFYVGIIEKVNKHSIYFKDFDINGIYSEGLIEIPFSVIDGITWNNTYTKGWEIYFSKIAPNKKENLL